MNKKEEKNKVGRPKLADNNLKKKSYIMLGVALLVIMSLIFGGIFSLTNIKTSNLKGEATTEDIYDVVLFFGQSNMVGSSGKYDSEDKQDQRLKREGVSKFSKSSGISKEILKKYKEMGFVSVDFKSNTAFEYLYLSDKIVELSSKTKYSGETLKYTGNTLVKGQSGNFDTKRSYGTNMIPYFLKTYSEKTNHKIVAVMTAHGAYEIDKFQPGTSMYNAMKTKYNAAINYLNKKGYAVGHKFYVVFQGEADVAYNTNGITYYNKFMNIHKGLKRDTGITDGFIVETSTKDGRKSNNIDALKTIHNEQQKLISKNSDIFLASNYPYRTFTPHQTQYNSEFKKSGVSYDAALKNSLLGKCVTSEDGDKNAIHFNSAALSQIGYEAAVNSSKVMKKRKVKINPGTCSVSVKVKDNVLYGINCTNNAKAQSVYMILSNKTYLLKDKLNAKTYSGSWQKDYASSFKRNGYVYIKYTDGVEKKSKIAKSTIFSLDTTNEYKNTCLNNTSKDICEKMDYHIDSEATYCDGFVYDIKSTNADFAIRCDANATPWRVEVLDQNENQIKGAVDGKDYDVNWKNNYGYRVSNRKINNLKNGNKYILRLTYLYVENINGKAVVRMTRSNKTFLAGTQEKTIEQQIKNTRYEKMNVGYGKKLDNGNCAISATSNSKQIKYKLVCEKNARPVSVRLTITKDHKAWERYYNNLTKVTYTSKYSNNEIFKSSKTQSGVIRNNFGSEAQSKGSNSYKMSEEGVIDNLESGKYGLQLYYLYKDPVTKKDTNYIQVLSENDLVIK